MHIAKLGAVAFVDNENHFLVFIRRHCRSIPRVLYCIGHFLDRSNDQLAILVTHLLNQNICAICCINRAGLKFVKLLHRLGIQVLTVDQEYHFFDLGVGCENLGSLKSGQRFTCTCGVPDVCITICEGGLADKRLCCIYLVRTHDHHNFIGII